MVSVTGGQRCTHMLDIEWEHPMLVELCAGELSATNPQSHLEVAYLKPTEMLNRAQISTVKCPQGPLPIQLPK